MSKGLQHPPEAAMFVTDSIKQHPDGLSAPRVSLVVVCAEGGARGEIMESIKCKVLSSGEQEYEQSDY